MKTSEAYLGLAQMSIMNILSRKLSLEKSSIIDVPYDALWPSASAQSYSSLSQLSLPRL